MKGTVKNLPSKKLTVSIHYSDQLELRRLLSMLSKSVLGGSICRHDTFGEGDYSMIVEDLKKDADFFEKLTDIEEPDYVSVIPKIEEIGGKIHHIYRSKMDNLRYSE